MKVLIIVIAVIAVLFIFIRKVARASLNPIDSISPTGTMGFTIGDSRAFVLSRIKHLHLASSEEWKDFKNASSIHKGAVPYIEVAHHLFGHINDVTFRFKEDKLDEIIILFDKNAEEIPEFFGIIEWRVAARIGEPTYKEKGITKWGHNISLFDNMEKDDKRALFLFVADCI